MVAQTRPNVALYMQCLYCVGRNRSVGIATRYGLGRSGDRIPVGARFSAPVQTGPGAYPASCTMGTVFFPGVKRPGRGLDHPPTSKCRGYERCRAIPLLTLWASVACYRENFTLCLYCRILNLVVLKVSSGH